MSKVSIIIPIYGVEKFIEKCARSLFEQTLSDMEYIFVNDCTQDKSIAILLSVLDEYPQRKSQVRILHNEKNQGQGVTRRRGILAATGDFVIHCDPDDWVELSMYEKMYKKAVQSQSEIVMCDFFKNYSDGREEIMNMANDIHKAQALVNLYTSARMGTLCGHLVARHIVQDKLLIWPEWNYTEDLALVFQYVMKANVLASIDEPLYHYRDNLQSISYENDDKLREDFLQTHILIERWCKELGIWEKMLPQRLATRFRSKARRLGAEKGNDSAAQKAWLYENPELGFMDLLKADLSFTMKIYSSILLLRLFPIINKIVNIRHRIWS